MPAAGGDLPGRGKLLGRCDDLVRLIDDRAIVARVAFDLEIFMDPDLDVDQAEAPREFVDPLLAQNGRHEHGDPGIRVIEVDLSLPATRITDALDRLRLRGRSSGISTLGLTSTASRLARGLRE